MGISEEELKELQKRPGVKAVRDSREGCQTSAGDSPDKRGRSPDKRETATKWRHPRSGKGGNKNDPEAQEQREFFHLVRSLESIYPELQMVRSDQAGMRTHPNQAKKAKAGGLRRGFPDIDVPIARNGYTGMHIEMKSKRGQLTKDQKWWLAQLRDQDRKCVVCRSARQAWEELSKYLGIEQEVK